MATRWRGCTRGWTCAGTTERVPHSRRTTVLKPLVFAAALLPLALLVWDGLAGGLGANPIEAIELRTGRWALRFIAITLAVTPLRRITGWNEVIRYRRMLGLFAFFYATLHLSAFIGLDMFFDVGDIVEDIVKHPYITIGMLTWLLLLPLAITSTKGWVRRLGGRRWNRLHRLIYVAAITGTVHYLWAVKKDTFLPLVYLTIIGALLAWRLWDWIARRRARTARARSATS
ncbi:protein-methionine-sulfoxide reductase heme-binding subunit MsrQ [soil metagenome]